MKDTLGDRMKEYENITRYFLPRRSNVIIRLDGKAFHTYTRNCKKPFDEQLQTDMDSTAISLCEKIQGAKLAYVQSDEITIVVTDYDTLTTDAWFGNNIQKMSSISASIATAEFNRRRMLRNYSEWSANRQSTYPSDFEMANFDSRVFSVPELAEVANNIIWRVQDATRNSIQMVARSHFSHSYLHGKDTTELLRLIELEGKSWKKYNNRSRFGGLIKKVDGKWKSVDIPEEHPFKFWNDLLNEVCIKTTE